MHSAEVLGLDPYTVVKTLVMQDQDAKPLLVLMHGNRKVSTKNLARQIGASVGACAPRSPTGTAATWWAARPLFGTRRTMPVTSKKPSLALPRIAINGGRRGLVQLDPQVLRATAGRQTGAVRAGPRIGPCDSARQKADPMISGLF